MDRLDREDLASMTIDTSYIEEESLYDDLFEVDTDESDFYAEDWRYENLTNEGTHADSLEWDDDRKEVIGTYSSVPWDDDDGD